MIQVRGVGGAVSVKDLGGRISGCLSKAACVRASNHGDVWCWGCRCLSEFRAVRMADSQALRNVAGWGQAEPVAGLGVSGM